MSVGGVSNYINSISSFYKYDYTNLNTKYNNTPVNYGNSSTQNSYVNKDAVTYLQSLKEGVKDLKNSLSTMNMSSTFNKMTVSSSSKEHVSISSSSEPTKGFQTASVEVRQIAAGQRNLGSTLKSDGAYEGETGLQQFEIEVDGNRQQYTVRVNDGDTNRQVQQKMSDVINAKSNGLWAQVIINQKDGTTALSIQSDNTGSDAKNSFTVTDRSGSLVASTGSANIVQQAQDAEYSVNGEWKTSKSNTVDLGNGVSATLRKATDEAVTVSAAQDKTYAVDKLKEMVNSYNGLITAATSSGAGGNTRLYNDLTTAMRSYSPSLEKLGISSDSDGKLSIDDKKLASAMEDGSLERFFSQHSSVVSYGFSNRINNIVGNVERNPSYYVTNNKPSVTWQPDEDASASFEDLSSTLVNSSSFNAKLYNQWYSLGYLFDLFI